MEKMEKAIDREVHALMEGVLANRNLVERIISSLEVSRPQPARLPEEEGVPMEQNIVIGQQQPETIEEILQEVTRIVVSTCAQMKDTLERLSGQVGKYKVIP